MQYDLHNLFFFNLLVWITLLPSYITDYTFRNKTYKTEL